MKNFALSKMNWVAVITVLLGALTSLQSLNFSPITMGYVVSAIGVLNFVLRTFFTNSSLTLTKPQGDI